MWNPRRVASCMTRSGKPQVPQEKGQSSHTKRGSVRAYPTPSRRRGRRHSSAATEKNPHTYTGTTSRVLLQGPDPHTHICEPSNIPASAYKPLPNLKLLHPDHQRWWPAAKTHKASHRRRERRGEKTDEAKKATPTV